MSINVSLSPGLEEWARSKVEQGLYSSMSELHREALRLLRSRDIEYRQALRADLDQAAVEIDRGDISPLNMSDIIDEAEGEITGGND